MNSKRPDYTEDQLLEMEEVERGQRMILVSEGKKSEHWKVLEDRIYSKIRQEDAYICSFSRNGMAGSDLEKFNLSVERKKMFSAFLSINEEIISENKYWLEQRTRQKAQKSAAQDKGKMGQAWDYVKTFVGMNGEEK